METFTVSQLAKEADVNIETVRYYERRQLMPEPRRSESGYRQYSQNDVKRIEFIKHAKELGFTLKEITELLSLRIDPNSSCGDVKERTEVKIADVKEKIRHLQRIKKTLTKLAASCDTGKTTDDCPILEALETK